MDSLIETLNLQTLLSSDLTDPTTPLSAPDLHLLTSNLHSHSLRIKSTVQTYLTSHQNEFHSLFSLLNDVVSHSNSLSHKLNDLSFLLTEKKIDLEIKEVVDEVRVKRNELREKSGVLGLVKGILGIWERLRGVKEGISNGRLRFVGEEIRELRRVLRVDEKEEFGEPVVYGILRSEWTECFEKIQELLVRLVDDAVKFQKDSCCVKVKYHLSVDGIDGVKLRDVFNAMEVVGILDYGLARVADQMIKNIITPVLNCGSSICFDDDVKNVSEETAEATFKIVPVDSKMEEMDSEILYSGVIQIIKFAFEAIFFQNGTWMRSFGRLTWPRISDLIISKFLSKAVPEDATKLADFQKIIKHTSEFETALKEMMFISPSDATDQRLSNFAENVEVHFASRKKKEILAKARSLLLQCDFSVHQKQDYARKGPNSGNGISARTSAPVVALLFLSEKCVISKAAFQLMELVHQSLKDVCLSSPRVAPELYHAARDVILLYEAVVPVKLDKQLDGINQVAVLIHNDCLYLSQEILGLAFEYRSDFPVSIREHAVFADLAPRFNITAEEILQRQIQLVVYNLKEAIDGADGFQNTHQIQQFESAKFSIDQVVFILEKVRIIWEPLLLPSTYKKSMCTVLESVFSRITKDILLLDDIAAEETLQLHRLIHLLLESLSSLIDSVLAVIQKEKSDEYSRFPLDNMIPSLRKIRKLAELLDMSLKSITAAWESAELVSFGFTISEMEDFIKAIFADSPLRKECLWRIQNVSL